MLQNGQKNRGESGILEMEKASGIFGSVKLYGRDNCATWMFVL